MDKCIIFDIDGTLFDTKKGIINALNDVLERYGEAPIECADQDKYIGPPVKKSFCDYNGFDENKATEATKLYRELYVEKYIQGSKTYDGIDLLLDELELRGYSLCIATMKTGAQVDKLLEESSLKDRFKMVCYALEDGSLSKAQMLMNIRNTIVADDYIFIGDTTGDYNASIDGNMKFIGVTYGYGFDKTSKYDFLTVESPSDIISFIS